MSPRKVCGTVLVLVLTTACSTVVHLRVTRDAEGRVKFQLVEPRTDTPSMTSTCSTSLSGRNSPASNGGSSGS